MAVIRVPERHRDTLLELASLDPEAIANLRVRIDASAPNREALTEAVGEIVGEPSDAIESLLALTSVRLLNDMSVERLAIELFDALGDPRAKGDLRPVLSSPRLTESARLYELASAWERGLQDFQVVNDVRPVFGDGSAIEGVMLSQKAILTYYESGSSKDIVFEVDLRDLKKFQNRAARALREAEEIKRVMSDRNLKVLTLEEESTEDD